MIVGLCRSSQKRESHQLQHDILSAGHSLLGISFITGLKSNLCTSITTKNTTINNYVITHTQNTTAFQPSLFCNLKMRVTGHTQGSVGSPVQTTAKVNCKLLSQCHQHHLKFQHYRYKAGYWTLSCARFIYLPSAFPEIGLCYPPILSFSKRFQALEFGLYFLLLSQLCVRVFACLILDDGPFMM